LSKLKKLVKLLVCNYLVNYCPSLHVRVINFRIIIIIIIIL